MIISLDNREIWHKVGLSRHGGVVSYLDDYTLKTYRVGQTVEFMTHKFHKELAAHRFRLPTKTELVLFGTKR